MSKGWAYAVGLPIQLAAIPWVAFVILRLWEWFAVPLFHVAPANKWQLYGFFVLVSYSVGMWTVLQRDQKRLEDAASILTEALRPWLIAASALLAGYIVRLFA